MKRQYFSLNSASSRRYNAIVCVLNAVADRIAESECPGYMLDEYRRLSAKADHMSFAVFCQERGLKLSNALP